MNFTSPMPTDDALAAYNANYFSSAHGGRGTNRVAVAFFAAMAKLRLAYVKKYISKWHVPIDTILEYGPGPGFFARNWFDRHGDVHYFAIETDKSCHEDLRQIGVKLVDSPDQISADLVVMSHVLEHVPDPIAFIKNATSGLKPGGVLFIEVPCQDWAHKDLDEPHILFFEKNSMQKLLEDQGLADIELGYFGQPIRELKRISPIRKTLNLLRSRILNRGLIAPFAMMRPGMESLADPMERAVVAPFRAHEEADEPAWWLRAVARKT